MEELQISLFGKFQIRCAEQSRQLETQKVEELLAYLLIYRTRPHFREKLATMLWPKSTTSQSRGYLRQTLWQLQSSLEENHNLLKLESDWIVIDDTADFWLDVAFFEEAFNATNGRLGKDLDDIQVQALKKAAALYQTDLLENWYQDWCLFERERLQNMYLAMLGKLVGYHEAHGLYDSCIIYASNILRCDRAHERTYRRLMRIYYLAGDRSGALRTYKRCTAELNDGLNVSPSERTSSLFELIRAGKPLDTVPRSSESTAAAASQIDLDRLVRLRRTLETAQQQLEREIESVRLALQQRS